MGTVDSEDMSALCAKTTVQKAKFYVIGGRSVRDSLSVSNAK